MLCTSQLDLCLGDTDVVWIPFSPVTRKRHWEELICHTEGCLLNLCAHFTCFSKINLANETVCIC